MKTSHAKFPFFTAIVFSFFLSACEKETEPNTYIQDYLDSLAIIDTIPVDLDVPCSVPANMIFYGAYNHQFTTFTCSDNNLSGCKITGTNPGDHVTIIITFKNRPQAGKYMTDRYNGAPPSTDSKVSIQYNTNVDHFTSLAGDTLYVEKLSGGITVFSFCDMKIDAGWGGYYADGKLEYNLSECE